jgi:ribosomal-protein-alanine N-acetyltransferase
MESTVTFRKMNIKDIDQIMVVEHESFTVPWSKEAFYNELTKNEEPDR